MNRSQSKMITSATVMAIAGVIIYILGSDFFKTLGILIISLSFITFSGDAFIKYKMTNKMEFLIMTLFFFGMMIVGMVMTFKLLTGGN